MEIRILVFGSADHAAALALRREVLGDPGCAPFTAEEIESERNDTHLGLFENFRLLGCMVLTHWSDTLLQVRQVSVRPELRRRGIGTRLMGAAERIGGERGYRLIGLYARPEAVAFYRTLGYQYDDEWPPEAEIPVQMSAKRIAPTQSSP